MRNWQPVRFGRALGGGLMSIFILFLAAPALAEHPDTSGEIENLKRRIEVLEADWQGADEAPFSLLGLGKRLSSRGE